jgi:DNA polymerase-3 subunit alpha
MFKMDFLGLKTLTVIREASDMVRERMGALRDPRTGATYEHTDDIPLDDPDVYRMLARGGTSGVFQFESRLASDKLRAMRCDRFEDLVATNALIRPGPLDSGMTDVYIRRKLGQEPVRYPHAALEKTLGPTYGVIVYQEQVIAIAHVLAGYSLGEADVLRQAVGKKDAELIVKELRAFVERAVARGVERRVAQELAGLIEKFGRYGFVKAHSSAYSAISYQTAWLKVHYPAEYMAALLSSVLDRTDDVVNYIGECREIGRVLPELADGIKVLPPDVNESRWKFRVTDDLSIRFGLGAVRGVGEGAVGSILAGREQGGPFQGLFDFLERIDLRVVNKRACEALIAAGALDSFGHRAQLLAGLDAAYSEVQARAADVAVGQGSLFESADEVMERILPRLPDVPEWDEQERLAREKEALGFFISGHPLDRYRDLSRAFGTANTATLRDFAGQDVELACVVTKVARQILRRDGTEWGKITVEDFHGTTTVLAFGDAWLMAKSVLVQDAAVLLRGTVSNRERDEEDPPVFLDTAEPLRDVGESGRIAVEIELPVGSEIAAGAFGRARTVLAAHPGPAPVEIRLANGGGGPGEPEAPRLRSRSLRVRPEQETLAAIREILGPAVVRLVRVDR